MGGLWVMRAGPSPRSARTATGLLLVEMRILHSRMTVGTAPSSAKRASRRPGAPAAASARLAAPLPGPAKDLLPLAVSGEAARRADLSGRPGRRHARALRPTQPTGPGRCGARDAGPAARPSRYRRRSALRPDAAVRPRRRPQPRHQSHERWSPPRHVARRQAHDSVEGVRPPPKARPVRAGPQGPHGRKPHRPGEGAVPAASQQSHPLSRLVV